MIDYKNIITRFKKSYRKTILIQTRNSYERYCIYEYCNKHNVNAEKIISDTEYMTYRYNEYSTPDHIRSKIDAGIHGHKWLDKEDMYKRPLVYIKLNK